MPKSVTFRPRLAAALLGATVTTLAPVLAAPPRGLTFEDRVAARRAIEEVYWRNRVWPPENPAPKPPLSAILSEGEIRSRVADDLRKSNALEIFWRRPIRPEQLQAELDRMVAGSRDPRMLGELFAALGHDPTLIAESLARPALVDRLIRSWYASDARVHGALRKKAEAALRSCRSLACMPSTGGQYRESTIRLGAATGAMGAKPGDATSLDAVEWQKLLDRLARRVGGEAASLRLLEPGGLEETADAFVLTAVLSQRNDEIRTASVSWPKTTFDAWWASVRDTVSDEADTGGATFTLAALAGPGCETDTWRPIAPRLPDPRVDHTAVWTGAEMIVWGGEGGVLLNTGGRYHPATDTWIPTSTGLNVPTARRLHTAVWTGTEMIVWGGAGPSALGTGGRYNPLMDSWTPTAGGATAPTARSGHTAVWTGAEMIVWGGSGGGFVNTGGRYDPSADVWAPTSVGATTPAGRSGHTAVWTGSRMIVWGGYNTTSGFVNTGGVYDPSFDAWSATSTGTNVPGARGDHTAVWTGSRMIIWGGALGGLMIFNSGSLYDPVTDTWSLVGTGGNAPSARAGHTAVWTGSEMIVWGGSNSLFALNTGARYLVAASSWSPVSPGPGMPSARLNHTAVWTGDEMIVWGGDDGVSVQDTGGRYDPLFESWAPTSTGQGVPTARSSHSLVWTGAEMIVWGGTNESSVQVNTGGRYDPAMDAWFATATDGMAPAARTDHAAVWTGTEMIVWGGYSSGSGYVNTGGRYKPSMNAWAPISAGTDLPAPRGGMTAVWTGTRMIVWGGYNASVYMNTGGRYDPAADMWAPTSMGTNVPAPRYAHSAVWTGQAMVIWGGYNGDRLNSGGRYDPLGDAWLETSTAVPAPTPRSGHSAVWTGSEMIVWGGLPDLNTGGRYDPATDLWTPLSNGLGTPPGRFAHAAVWTGSEMIVWGGRNGGYVNTGGRYDPSSDTWSPTSTGANVPIARYAHVAVWTGQEMIVWGDSNGTRLRSGGAYCACPNGTLYHRDADGDGYGDPTLSWATCDGTVPSGFVADGTDCDDASTSTNPGATEMCNGTDDDCSGSTDDVRLTMSRATDATILSWSPVLGSRGYDVVRGSLTTLNASRGDFTASIDACLADDLGSTSLEDPDGRLSGDAVFYLLKAVGCGGSWNSGGPGQQGDRDPEIAAAAAACP